MSHNNESSVRFSDLLYLFISKLWIMILVMVIVGGSLFAYNYITYQPMYKSTAVMIVGQVEGEQTSNYTMNVNNALMAVENCKGILTSERVLDRVIKENYLTVSYKQFKSEVTVTNAEQSTLIEVTAKANDPKKAKMIVDSICANGELAFEDTYKTYVADIYSEGSFEDTAINSRFSLASILIGIASFILTYIIFVLFYIFDDKVSDPDLVERNLGLPVLALIPNMKSSKSKDVNYGQAIQRHRYYSKHMKGNK